jgi:hypothetical protein
VKSLRSETWNSETRGPLPVDVPMRTVRVGRSVSTCASLTGASAVGAVSPADPGVLGVGPFGASPDPPHEIATVMAALAAVRATASSFNCSFRTPQFVGGNIYGKICNVLYFE